jgi:hypothetical protein
LLYLVLFYNQLWCFGSGGALLSNHLRTFEVHAEKIHSLLYVEVGEENADVNTLSFVTFLSPWNLDISQTQFTPAYDVPRKSM